MCERFNIDGLELDFQRFPHYFKHADGIAWENRDIMTRFVQRVREMAVSVKGDDFLLAVRVPSSLEACRTVGLNVEQWVEEGLVDFVTAAPFLTTEFDIPVGDFRERFSSYGVPVYVGLEFSFLGRPMTREVFRAAAMNYLDKNADGDLPV